MNRNDMWTPVGIDLTGTKTVEEALNKAELNWEVHKKPIFNEHGIEIPEWYQNVRSDNGATLGIVTGKYKIVQNHAAFEFVNNLLGEGTELESGGVFHRGKAVWLEAKMPGEYNILGDKVDSHVVFVNSHDGKGAVKVCMTPNRLACSNQIAVTLKNAARRWAAVHSSKVDERIVEARETLGLADAYMKALVKEAETLAMKKMSDEEFFAIIDKIYPIEEDASNRKITNVSEIKNGIKACLKAPDLADYTGTAWGKMNAVTDYFSHREPQRKTAEFESARWESFVKGNTDVDKFYDAILMA